MTQWTVGISVCVATSCSLRDVNLAVIAALESGFAAAAEVNIVVQTITGTSATGEASGRHSVNGVAGPPQVLGELGAGEHLSKLAAVMNATNPNAKKMLWIISHGGTAGRRDKVKVGNEIKTITVETITTDPTQRNPIALPLATAGGRPPNAPAVRLFRTALYADDYGAALAGAQLDLIFLQSCQAGGLDLLDGLFSSAAAAHVVASASNLPLPSDEVAAFTQFLNTNPGSDGATVATHLCNSIVAATARPNPNVASGWPATTDASPFVASASEWSAFVNAFSAHNNAIEAYLSNNANAAQRAALGSWLADDANRVEVRANRVAVNEWIRWAAAQSGWPSSAALQATHNKLFPHLPFGGPKSRALSAGLSTTTNVASPRNFFAAADWTKVLSALS